LTPTARMVARHTNRRRGAGGKEGVVFALSRRPYLGPRTSHYGMFIDHTNVQTGSTGARLRERRSITGLSERSPFKWGSAARVGVCCVWVWPVAFGTTP